MVKWGGEGSIVKIKEMIHIAGIDKAQENIEWAFKQKPHGLPEEFKEWITQGLRYIKDHVNAQN